MDDRRAPMDTGEAERRFAARLEEAALPRFASAVHDPALERAVILSLSPCCEACGPIDGMSPAPRTTRAPAPLSPAS